MSKILFGLAACVDSKSILLRKNCFNSYVFSALSCRLYRRPCILNTSCVFVVHYKQELGGNSLMLCSRCFKTSEFARRDKKELDESFNQNIVREAPNLSCSNINFDSEHTAHVSGRDHDKQLQYDGAENISESLDGRRNPENHPLTDTDVDQELLRYDYEEFEETVDGPEEIDEVTFRKPLPIELTRGKSGVFDVEELVSLLEDEKARDVCVLPVPKECHYVDYLVVATGRSTRHLKAMAEFIRWAYKRKRADSDPATVKIEGQQTRDWFAMDLGNIAVHLFLHETRLRYDLETLWTIGDTHEIQVPDVGDELSSFREDFSFDDELERLRRLRDSEIQQRKDKQQDVENAKRIDKHAKVRSMENLNSWHSMPDN